MDIEALLKSIGEAAAPRNQSDNTALQIESMTLKAAAHAGGASQATGAIIQCMVAATLPLVNGFYGENQDKKAPAQDRFLFALILAGAAASVKEVSDGMNLEVSVTPHTIREALDTYTKLTGRDISPYLPPRMVAFAKSEPQQAN